MTTARTAIASARRLIDNPTPNVIHDTQQLAIAVPYLLDEIDRLNKVADLLASSNQAEAWAFKYRQIKRVIEALTADD